MDCKEEFIASQRALVETQGRWDSLNCLSKRMIREIKKLALEEYVEKAWRCVLVERCYPVLHRVSNVKWRKVRGSNWAVRRSYY